MNIIDNFSYFENMNIDRLEVNHGSITLFLSKYDGSLVKRQYVFKSEHVTLPVEGIN